MYSDPALIREHVVKLRLNENEADLIDAWVKYTGQQKAVLLREMLLDNAAERAMIKRIAQRDGITVEEAANNLVKACLARRVKKRTGKNPAKVYTIRK